MREQRPLYWLSRLIVPLEVLFIVVGVSWFEPLSLTARALNASGPLAWALLVVLGAFCAAAILDVVINDLMPPRFALRYAMRWRHLSFMGISLILGMISVLIVVAQGFTVLLFAYWLNAIFAAGLTFLDAFTRLRLPK